MRARSTLSAVVAGAAVLLGAGVAPASAMAGRATLYVGAPGSGRGGCARPGYTNVQAAVDAAPVGATVYLCGTTPFAGQVFIDKTVSLTGAPGASIAAPGASGFAAASSARLPAIFQSDLLAAPQAIVVVTGGSPVITGLTIAGPLPGNGGCAVDEFGVLVLGGATTTLDQDAVVNIHDASATLYGCQFGVGIQVGRDYWPTADFTTFETVSFAGHAKINDTTVSGYQKNGVTVDGPGSTAAVDHDVVLGSGRDSLFAPIIAQNGIQISRGARADINGSTVRGNSYTGPGDAFATGILIYGGCGDPLVTGVLLAGNTLVNNDVGISLSNYNPACTSNAPTPTRDVASGNLISNDEVSNISGYCTPSFSCPGDGYQAGIDDIGDLDIIAGNLISGPGYAPAGSIADPAPAFVRPVDTISYPTSDPIVIGNLYDHIPYP